MTGNRLFVLLISTLIVATVALGWVLGIAPVLAQADEAASQQRQVEAENAQHQARLTELMGLYEELPELRTELFELQRAVPASRDIDRVLDELNALATATGVTLTSIGVTEATAYGLNADGTSSVSAPPAADPEEGGTRQCPASTALPPQMVRHRSRCPAQYFPTPSSPSQ